MDIIMSKEFVLSLTNISYGTLLACCRESVTFKNIDKEYDTLDKIKTAWINFLVKDDNFQHCPTWVDAWILFSKYAETEAVEDFKLTMYHHYEGFHVEDVKGEAEKDGYTAIKTRMGVCYAFNSGVVSFGLNSPQTCFAATFLDRQETRLQA